jgi:hypothetical protein
MARDGARTSWLVAWLLAESWACVNLAAVLPVAEELSRRRYRGWPPFLLPDWAVPVLLGAAAAGVACTVLLLAFRERLAPLASRTWWFTRYLLVIGISSLLIGLGHLRAYLDSTPDPQSFLPPEIHDVYGVGACLFLTTSVLPLVAWFARRRGSRFAGTLTASANLVLAAYVPGGLIPLAQWLQWVRPEEEGARPAAQ